MQFVKHKFIKSTYRIIQISTRVITIYLLTYVISQIFTISFHPNNNRKSQLIIMFPGTQGEGIHLDYSIYIRTSVLIPLVFMLAISAVVGKRTASISHKYSTIVTPPGPFFAIWGIIYIGLIVSGIYQAVNNVWSLGVTVMYGVVCLLNGLWVFTFDKSSILTNNICTVMVLLMAVCNQLQWSWMQMPENNTWNIVNRNIFAFYQGWLVGAFNLNLGVTLIYGLGIDKKMQTWIFWIVCPLCIIGMVILNLYHKDGFINNIAMYVSAGWALAGAFISTKRNYSSAQPDSKQQQLIQGHKEK